ncbi:hypothetical protein LPJ70_007740, partial [Coemansia sp. RSA 2708]
TIYIRNLNDKIPKDVLKQALYGLCIAYGQVLDIVALKTMKMRGQAFIVFGDITAATAALRQLNGRKIFTRPMQIEYALSKSTLVAQNDGTYRFDQPHQHMSAKQRKQQLGIIGDAREKRRQSNADDEHAAKRRTTEAQDRIAEESSDDDIGPAAPRKQSPSKTGTAERPSSTLFVTNLPDTVSVDMLTGLFRQYAGFREVREIPGKGDMVFVDYTSAESAAAARDVLDGFKLSAKQAMKVAFSR